MNRIMYLFGGLLVAALVVLSLVAATPPDDKDKGEKDYPVWVGVPGASLQMTTYQGVPVPYASPPNGPNGGKFHLTGQLVRNTTLQPPFMPEALPIASVTITPAPPPASGPAPNFATPACTYSGTWLSCEFGPTGGLWAQPGQAVFRVHVTSTSGYGAMTLISFRVN